MKTATDGQLRVGVGRADVTPPLGTRLCGYPEPDRFAESIHDPLHATALVSRSHQHFCRMCGTV